MRRLLEKPRPLFASLAVLFWAGTAHAAVSPDICQSDKNCSVHTDRAVTLAQDSDYHGALEELLAAYGVQPEPRLLVNIGRCLFHLKRFHEAIEYYRRFQKAPSFHAESALRQTCSDYIGEAKAAIASARASGVGYLVLAVGGRGAHIVVDEYEVGVAPLSRTVELKAGRHRVEMRGEHSTKSEVTIDAGKELSFSFDGPSEAVTLGTTRERLPRPRWRIYGGAATIALGVLFIGLGAGALSVNGQCQTVNAGGLCAAMVGADNMRQTLVYDSVGMGAGLIVPGLLLTGAGIGLIAWPGPQREVAASAAQAGAGFSLSF